MPVNPLVDPAAPIPPADLQVQPLPDVLCDLSSVAPILHQTADTTHTLAPVFSTVDSTEDEADDPPISVLPPSAVPLARTASLLALPSDQHSLAEKEPPV